uniref:Uncharacterized protein n=1 Tax=Myoviridae sp. ctLnO19 TaxID=2825085 RepID=A0A8S5P1A5_9CAUD|nr:MAG TPA: hypothetical protein [Myoviridae sp. ctLnO19]
MGRVVFIHSVNLIHSSCSSIEEESIVLLFTVLQTEPLLTPVSLMCST